MKLKLDIEWADEPHSSFTEEKAEGNLISQTFEIEIRTEITPEEKQAEVLRFLELARFLVEK